MSLVHSSASAGGCPSYDKFYTSSLSKEVFKAESSTNEKISQELHRFIYLFGIVGAPAIARMLYTRSIRPLKLNTVFLLAFVFTARKVGLVIAGYFVYRAAARSTLCPYLYLSNRFEKRRVAAVKALENRGFQVNRMTLQRLNTQYDAYLATREETEKNGKWMLHIGGVERIVENSMSKIVRRNEDLPVNHLFVNGPSVGRSKGYPTPFHMRNANEAALQFLEKIIKAAYIAVRAYSLGGGIVSEVVAQHKFPENIQYLIITEVSFRSLAATSADIAGCIVKPLFHFLGMELNGVKGAKILAKKNIRHIVIQHKSNDCPTDGVISDSLGLAKALEEYSEQWDNLVLMESEAIVHDRRFPGEVKALLNDEIKKFLGQESEN